MQSALVNHKVALGGARCVHVELWLQLKDVVTELEADGSEFRGNCGTALGHVAEGSAHHAVQARQSRSPFLPDIFEDVRRDLQLRAACVYYCRVGRVLARFLHSL